MTYTQVAEINVTSRPKWSGISEALEAFVGEFVAVVVHLWVL